MKGLCGKCNIWFDTIDQHDILCIKLQDDAKVVKQVKLIFEKIAAGQIKLEKEENE